MNLEKISKYLSLILRHKPEEIGITLDKYGYAKTSDIIKGIKRKYPEFTKEMLIEIVKTDDKQRYKFKDYENLIRANQGHSIPVDLELEEQIPPKILYHGTSNKYLTNIMMEGLIPKSRQYVHLSNNTFTAYKVGQRHGGKTIICLIDTLSMYKNGYKFYISENGVWLTHKVPPEYIVPIHVDNSHESLTQLNDSIAESERLGITFLKG